MSTRGGKVSAHEETVASVLKELFPHHEFIKVRPTWMENPKTGHAMELDFYSEDLKVAIECNGTQHYKKGFSMDDKAFSDQLLRDAQKTLLCTYQDVVLVTIPYTVADKGAVKGYLEQRLHYHIHGRRGNRGGCILV